MVNIFSRTPPLSYHCFCCGIYKDGIKIHQSSKIRCFGASVLGSLLWSNTGHSEGFCVADNQNQEAEVDV